MHLLRTREEGILSVRCALVDVLSASLDRSNLPKCARFPTDRKVGTLGIGLLEPSPISRQLARARCSQNSLPESLQNDRYLGESVPHPLYLLQECLDLGDDAALLSERGNGDFELSKYGLTDICLRSALTQF